MAAKNPLEEDALDRLQQARMQKSHAKGDIRESYWFAAPFLSRTIETYSRPQETRPSTAGEIATSVAMEAGDDFATEVLNAYLPEQTPWAKLKPTEFVPPEYATKAQQQAEVLNLAIFTDISASNFQAAVAQALFPDLCHGTIGLWIEEGRNSAEPAVCTTLQTRELEINFGPDGKVDDRFAVRWYRARDLERALSDDEIKALPEEIKKLRKDRPNTELDVTHGFWRNWKNRDDVEFQRVTLVKKHLVGDGIMKGVGCCPLMVGRFRPMARQAWGIGPTIMSLPEIRKLDALRDLNEKHLDYAVHPPFTFPNDGTINFETRLEPGMGVPITPGSGDDFKSLYFEGKWDAGYLEEDKFRRMIRRLHYVDFPEQTGKTPPTATQWNDEMLKAQRRLGTPGRIFFEEFCSEVHRRFMYMRIKRHGGQVSVAGRQISVSPHNPADQARDQQAVMQARGLVEFIAVNFPQIAPVVINAPTTIEKIKLALGDRLVDVRSPEEITAAMQQMAPLLQGGAGGGGPPQGGMPA